MAEEKVTPAVEEAASVAEKKKPAPKKKAAPKVEGAEKQPAAKKPAAKKAPADDAKKADAKKEKEAAKPAAQPKAAKAKPASTGNTVTVKATAKTKEEKLAAGTLKLILKRGLMGCTKRQKAVVFSLGLKRPGDMSVQPDNAATQGKLAKIDFLLSVSRA